MRAIIEKKDTIARAIQYYMLRHEAKPGITGWAGINGWRDETENLVGYFSKRDLLIL